MSAPFSGLPRLDLRRPASASDHQGWRVRCHRSAGLAGEADQVAREIIAAIQAEGDAALLRMIAQFERRDVRAEDLEIRPEAWKAAERRVPEDVLAALALAADRVLRFHRTQKFATTGFEHAGQSLHSRAAPLRRVAVYAPGGTAAYPSSVLMTAIPAKVAGVAEVILFTPRASDVVLAAARLAGVDRVFELGGAQAIAAAALGTATIPRVDKIVGPGNAYVTAAKRQVYGLCDIDSIAGPSEILVVADATADARIIAADLISQAEHDTLSCAVLVTDAPQLLDAVDEALRTQLEDLPRRDIATTALLDHGAAVVVADRSGMIAAANAYAPEHLELLVEGAEHMAAAITSAGAIFVGAWTPEAAGDYTAGPSHVLPTAGAARFASPLGVWDFIKYTSVLRLEAPALIAQSDAITRLARAEGLEGHARAVEIRLQMAKENQ